MPAKLIFIIFISFASMYAFLLFKSRQTITPYLGQRHIKVRQAVFVDYLVTRIIYAIVALGFETLIAMLFPAFKTEFNIVTWLFCIYILDYWIMYHNPFVRIFSIPISYSLIMGLVLFCLTISSTIKWFHLK